jgi:type II secretory pathway pseudopilin PulG
MIKFNFKKNKGFTLLEALVATSILMVAISAPITIAQKGLSSAIFTKNQMIASYLAQDVIEYIKNQRDEVVINNTAGDWGDIWKGGDGFDYFKRCVDPTGCQIDTLDGTVDTFQPNNFLSKGRTDKFYGYNDADTDQTSFTRKVTVDLMPVNMYNPLTGLPTELYDEALITVTVSWGAGEDDKLVVKTLIFNN